MNPKALKSLGRAVIETEAAAVGELLERVDDRFVEACQAMLACSGRIVVIGMGKSGHVGGKIAATLASTGTPAFFVHPAEAGHGDLGMIKSEDVVLLLSNSGETAEINSMLPALKRLGVTVLAMTGCISPEALPSRTDAVIRIDESGFLRSWETMARICSRKRTARRSCW